MKLKIFGLIIISFGFLFCTKVYGKLYVQGTQSHFVFMDVSSEMNFESSPKSFCGDAILVKDSNKFIDSSLGNPDYTYDSAGNFACLALETFDHGPGDVDVDVTSTSLVDNLWLSKHHKLNFTNVGDTVFDGQTHFVHCARETAEPSGLDPMIIISGGQEVEFKNVVLKDFSSKYIDLQNNSNVLFGDGTTIELGGNEPLDPSYTITCEGKVVINCFGNKLDLSNNFYAIDVLPSSTLTIQNGYIIGLKASNLRCLGSDSTLTLSNCSLELESDYTFSYGYLNIYQDVEVIGLNTFEFKSPQPMNIRTNGRFEFGMNTTFSYAAEKEKLVFADKSSQLIFSGSKLYATDSGLELTKGTLIIDHIVEFGSGASDETEAIMFGNGTASDNLNVEVMPGGDIRMISGYINYLNAEV